MSWWSNITLFSSYTERAAAATITNVYQLAVDSTPPALQTVATIMQNNDDYNITQRAENDCQFPKVIKELGCVIENATSSTIQATLQVFSCDENPNYYTGLNVIAAADQACRQPVSLVLVSEYVAVLIGALTAALLTAVGITLFCKRQRYCQGAVRAEEEAEVEAEVEATPTTRLHRGQGSHYL